MRRQRLREILSCERLETRDCPSGILPYMLLHPAVVRPVAPVAQVSAPATPVSNTITTTIAWAPFPGAYSYMVRVANSYGQVLIMQKVPATQLSLKVTLPTDPANYSATRGGFVVGIMVYNQSNQQIAYLPAKIPGF